MAAGLQGVFHHHFEWDPAKASSNLRKHGIDFGQAATVFEDPLSMSMPDEEASGTEERWVTMGQTQNGRLPVAAHTWRRRDEDRAAAIRIISARPAQPRERRRYEEGQ